MLKGNLYTWFKNLFCFSVQTLLFITGLQEVEEECNDLQINFHLVRGESKICVPELVEKLKLDAVVTDFSPLRVPLSWVEHVKKALPKDVPFCQVNK